MRARSRTLFVGCLGRSARMAAIVDEVLQFLARLEVRHFLRRHVHLLARLRIAPLARLAPPQPETAKAAQLDLLAAMQRIDDGLEHGIDDDLGMLLGEVRYATDFLDQFGFSHGSEVPG